MKFQWRRDEDKEIEDLKVYTVWVITEGLEHPLEAEPSLTKPRKKTMVCTSDMSEENFNKVILERAKAISQVGFQTFPWRDSDSSDEEDDILAYTFNKDPVLAKIKR